LFVLLLLLFPRVFVFERELLESLEKFDVVLLLRSVVDDCSVERTGILGTNGVDLLIFVLIMSDETTDAYDFGPPEEGA